MSLASNGRDSDLTFGNLAEVDTYSGTLVAILRRALVHLFAVGLQKATHINHDCCL